MKNWYIIQSHSSFENKVAGLIKEEAEKAEISEKIEQIVVPTHDVTEVKRGKRIQRKKKYFPGYVLIKSEMDNNIYHMIKNIKRVSGFLGSKGTPVPVSDTEIEKILDEHPEENGMIFVTSYDYQNMIMKGISQKYLERIFEIKRDENKTKKVDEFKSYKNKVAISPVLWFGYDFKDDMSRFQIIVKAPYAPWGEQRTKAKRETLDHGKYWYNLLACQKLVQGCGRSIRNKNDYAVTYLLDESIQDLLEKIKQNQEWFYDAVEGPETII